MYITIKEAHVELSGQEAFEFAYCMHDFAKKIVKNISGNRTEDSVAIKNVRPYIELAAKMYMAAGHSWTEAAIEKDLLDAKHEAEAEHDKKHATQ